MATTSLRQALGAVLLVALASAACSAGDTADQERGGSPSPDRAAGADPSPLIDPDLIISGGPPPDGIPPIDDPRFLAVDEVTYLEDREPVIAVEGGGIAKAYPVRILMWHEIVNDDFDGDPVVVTYCPLCNTGIAYERPTIDGELLDFGTSGKLYFSNLVMYDRQTESYWPQALGQAVMGPLTGERLDPLPARILSWADWRAAHPDGLVLSIDTGHRRDYGTNPYVGYDASDDPFLFTGEIDPRLPPTERVLGIVGRDPIAFAYSDLAALASGGAAVVEGTFDGRDLAVFWSAGTASALDEAEIAGSRDVGAAAVYVPVVDGERLSFEIVDGDIVDTRTRSTWSIVGRAIDGPLAGIQLEVAVATDSFWFDWAAFHPDTEIWSEAG